MVNDLIDCAAGAGAPNTFKRMIDHNAIFQLVYQKGFLSKREIGELFRHRTEHIQLRFRVEIVQQKRCKKAEIAIAPNANAISPRMRNRIKAGNRMATNADELRKRGHLERHAFRRRHQPIRLKHHIILQKPRIRWSGKN